MKWLREEWFYLKREDARYPETNHLMGVGYREDKKVFYAVGPFPVYAENPNHSTSLTSIRNAFDGCLRILRSKCRSLKTGNVEYGLIDDHCPTDEDFLKCLSDLMMRVLPTDLLVSFPNWIQEDKQHVFDISPEGGGKCRVCGKGMNNIVTINENCSGR